MKKAILFLSMVAVFAACKKDKSTSEFTATDVTGTTMVKGNTSKMVITPNGFGGWTANTKVPAPNVHVAVTVNRSSLYPNSNAQGADVYSAVTDANGNYNIAVKSNAAGVAAKITIDGFTGTQDTLINGTLKKGLYSNFPGTNMATVLVMGQNYTLDHNFVPNNSVSNPNQIDIGTAVITGSVSIQKYKQTVVGTSTTYPLGFVAQPNHKVFLKIDKDPVTLAPKIYETTTDTWGYYRFTVNTVPTGQSGFFQNVDIWVDDYAASRDTVLTNASIKTGFSGVYTKKMTPQIMGVYNNAIRNGNHLYYNAFIPD